MKCTKPENISVVSKKRKMLSLEWDAPNDMGELQKFLHYLILIAEDGADKNQVISENKINLCTMCSVIWMMISVS